MNDSQSTSRRSFLKSAALAGIAAAASGGLAQTASGKRGGSLPTLPARDVMAPKLDTLRIAYIGTGGIGNSHLKGTRELGVTCPCYCDIDTERMEMAAEFYPDAKPYQDYREMFDKEKDNFDAVMVGTPDHHHYPATILAMRLGKHVYTQKPLTHTAWEARQLKLAAEQYPVATQMGNQGHAGEGWRLIYEWVHSGALGDVTEAHSWTDRPIWPQALTRPEETDEVPPSVNWDAWLGPAPAAPYKKELCHPFAWRGWWDYGAGALGDMACHTMDGVFWALQPGYPTAVEPLAATPITPDCYPNSSMIKWEFPASHWRPGFTAYWYDGNLKPPYPPELEIGREWASTGNLFVGTKAKLFVSGSYGQSPRIIPETKMKEIGKPPQMLERSPGHMEEWIMAAKGEKPIDFPKSRFAYAAPMTETIALGNIALRVGRRLEWDGEKMEFTNCPEANQYVSKEYREGWKF